MSRFKYYTLEQLVKYFIEQGNESDCWDFKQEWHDDMSSLIKDIICFTNTVHDEDCYLIFGVDDKCNVVGMKKTRILQVSIIDAISKLTFAGDIAPQIEVKTIIIDGVNLDILIIRNIDKTPVFLKISYGKMIAGNIYLRTGDKNTPDRGNAEIPDIEMLWKKRLGLTKTPLEYIYDRLNNPLEWKSQGNVYYNIYRPEYTLVKVDNDEFRDTNEFYSYAMYNKSTMFYRLEIKCHETVLDEYRLAVLDSGRYITPVPEWGFVCRDRYDMNSKYGYIYFIVGSNLYTVHRFFYNPDDDEQRIARDRFFEIVVLYNSDEERITFESYIEGNQNILDDAILSITRYSHIHSGDEYQTEYNIKHLHTGIALNVLLKEYRTSYIDI